MVDYFTMHFLRWGVPMKNRIVVELDYRGEVIGIACDRTDAEVYIRAPKTRNENSRAFQHDADVGSQFVDAYFVGQLVSSPIKDGDNFKAVAPAKRFNPFMIIEGGKG
jgi:uncharacterized protein YuzE